MNQGELPVGTKIGRLTVIGKGEPVIRSGKIVSMTKVQCSCESKTIKEIPTMYLTKSRPILSCGCAQKNRINPHIPKHLPRISKGYRYVYAPESPSAKKSGSYKGYVFEHRLVMERYLGRSLSEDETIHHIDFNKLNNDVSNLMVLSNSEHARLHNLIKQKLVNKESVRKIRRKRLAPQNLKRCIDCGKELSVIESSKSKIQRCRECSILKSHKCIWPDKEQLTEDLTGSSMEATARKYGVTGNSVKNWCKKYNISYKNIVRRKGFSENARKKAFSEEAIMKRKISQQRWYSEHRSNCCKAVICYTKDMQIVKEYQSLSEAKLDGFLDSPIARCCRGKLKTYRGYVWRYKEAS